jgi:predicted TIM-barrel fold metal-dependent hydrolase
VSSKIAGDTASLTDPALDRIFDFCAEAGLVVILHNDIDVPYPKPDQEPWELKQMADLFRRHPETQVIWAHIGVGRVVRPLANQAELIERALGDPTLAHVYFDISWTEAAKYIVASPESIARAARLINDHPDRFLFGTDEVAPKDQAQYLKIYDIYGPLLAQLTPEAREKLLKGNYERLFDEARLRVRAWEKANVKP